MSTAEHDLGPEAPAPGGDMRRRTTFREKVEVMGQRNFIVYWLSGTISFLGDNFAFIALPLLITSMSEDATTLGLVMAAGGIPRIVLTLFGGAISDRFSAIRVMLWTRLLYAATFAVYALLLWTGTINIPLLYVFSIVGGIIGSFLFPAQMALLPSLVNPRDLPPANAVNGGTQQIIQAFAPAIVGFVIAILSGYDIFAEVQETVTFDEQLNAYGWAFVINTAAIAVAALLLLVMQPLRDERAEGGVLQTIVAGLVYIWRDPPLRALMIYIGLSQLFSMGAQMVGTPIMASERHELYNAPTAVLLGMFGTASGAGAAVGSLMAGLLPIPGERQYGPVMITLGFLRGISLIGLGFVSSLYGVLLMFALFGGLMGYTMVIFMVWMQTRVEISMLGRAMSIVMLASMGVAPVSSAFAGWAIDFYSLELLFIGSGAFMIVVATGAYFVPSMRLMGYTPARALEILNGRKRSGT